METTEKYMKSDLMINLQNIDINNVLYDDVEENIILRQLDALRNPNLNVKLFVL